MLNRIFAVVLLIAISQGSWAQSGKMISQKEIQLPDSLLHRIAKNFPEVIGFNESTRCFRITYVSDGLKVNGYLVVPKKPGKYPCVIYNRGGNREFGKLDHGDYGYYMAQIASWGYVVVGSQYRGNDQSRWHDDVYLAEENDPVKGGGSCFGDYRLD